MNKIQNIGEVQLLEYYRAAICDNHYNPQSAPYNISGFTLEELEEEIYRRLQQDVTNKYKQIAWKAYMEHTTEKEFFMCYRKSAKDEFEKWWDKNNNYGSNKQKY